MCVADLGLDERKVGLQPALANVGPAVKLLDGLALGKLGAIGRRGIKRRNARTAGTDALGQRALGHQFQLDFPGEIIVGKCPRVGCPGKGTYYLAHHPGVDHRRYSDAAVAGVVVDDREFAGAGFDECVDELDRRSRTAETANHHRRSVTDPGHGVTQAGNCFVHGSVNSFSRPHMPVVQIEKSGSGGNSFRAI